MTIASIDAEIAQMRIESQIYAYKSQRMENKKKLLELEKNRQAFQNQIDDLEIKIRELESSIAQ